MSATATSTRQAGWLPGVQPSDIQQHQTLVFGTLEVRILLLTPAGLHALIQRIGANRDAYLADMPVYRIVSLLDRVASRWLDPASPSRREAEALLPVVTGYAEPAVRKGLSTYLASLRAENIRRLLEEELANPLVLDTFQARPRGGGETRAFDPRLTTHIWSGNVPGIPAQSLLSATLVKSASLGKFAREEPIFASLLVESVAEVDSRLADCLAVVYCPGGDEALEKAVFEASDAVIAYGGERAIESIRGRIQPSARFMAYGHKLSFGVVGSEALSADLLAETADRAAYDVIKYDQQGCLSPHLFYIEAGGGTTPAAFAAALGEALATYQRLVPRGRLGFEEAASAAGARQAHELRQPAGEPVALIEGDGWAVLFDADPTFQPSCLNRKVWIKPVADIVLDVPRLVAPSDATCRPAAWLPRRTARALLPKALGDLGWTACVPWGGGGWPTSRPPGITTVSSPSFRSCGGRT